MKIWTSVSAAVTAIALVATLGACGGGDDADEGGATTITLGYYAEAGGPADGTMRALVTEFSAANPDIKVKIESAAYDEFYTRLRTQLAGRTAPDVWLSDGALIQEYAGRKSLRDLSPYVQGADIGEYYGVDLIRKGDAKGRLFGFPQGAQTNALFYNKKLFKDAGVAEPTPEWTYDDLAAAAKKLTKDTNKDGKPDVYGFRAYSKSFAESWWPMVKAFGGDILDDQGKVVVDSPGSAQALNWMLTAMYDDKVAPDVVTTDALGGSQTLFPSGVVAMQFGIYARIQTATQGKIDFGVAPLPKGPSGKRGQTANINAWVINQAATDPKAAAAWKWIQFFSGEKPQATWTGIGEAIPINKKVAASAAFVDPGRPPADRQVFTEALTGADDLGINPVWSEYTAAITKPITSALSREVPVAAGLKTAQTDGQAAIDRFNPGG
jgi:multiple sugar transport system substrate-binding protein